MYQLKLLVTTIEPKVGVGHTIILTAANLSCHYLRVPLLAVLAQPVSV